MTALEFLTEYINTIDRIGAENLAECRVFIITDGSYKSPEIDVKFGDIVIRGGVKK